jgi:hypothetical protein
MRMPEKIIQRSQERMPDDDEAEGAAFFVRRCGRFFSVRAVSMSEESALVPRLKSEGSRASSQGSALTKRKSLYWARKLLA